MVSAAQTPEEEVHGPLLDAFVARHRTLLVDLDAYAASAERRESRRAAWARLAAAHGVEASSIGGARERRPPRPISHTNVGEPLARTLLRRDVGEIVDATHTTLDNHKHVLEETEDGALVLWDTPVSATRHA